MYKRQVLTNFGDDRLHELVQLLENAGSFEYSRVLVSNHVERALEHLEALPDSDERILLSEMALISEARTN